MGVGGEVWVGNGYGGGIGLGKYGYQRGSRESFRVGLDTSAAVALSGGGRPRGVSNDLGVWRFRVIPER